MNIDTMHKAIIMIDSDLIEAADVQPEKAKPTAFKPWMKWAVAAAAFCVVVAGTLVILNTASVFGSVAENDPKLDHHSTNGEASEFVSSISGENYENSLEAYNYFLETVLSHNKYGDAIYPEDYAGQYINGDKFVLRLTDTGEENLNKYREKMGKKYAECLEFEKADYSYSYIWSKAHDAQIYLVGKPLVTCCMSNVPQSGDHVDITVITYDFTEEELEAELVELYGVPFNVTIDLDYYGDTEYFKYAGTADIIEGFDAHIIDGRDGDIMFVIRNGQRYKLNVITRQQAIEKYGNYAGFKSESQSAIIYPSGTIEGVNTSPSGAIETVQALYNYDLKVDYGDGEFVKPKTEVTEFEIDGVYWKFTYFKSKKIVRYPDSELDGIERSYVIDYYKCENGYVVSKYEGHAQLLSLSTANVLNAPKQISKDDAVAMARSIALKSPYFGIGVDRLEGASVEVRDSSYYIVKMTSRFGCLTAIFNYSGELLKMSWYDDASRGLPAERIEAAKAKMNAAIEKWETAHPGARYVVDNVTFSYIGEDIEAVFDVIYYPDPDNDACSVYPYYCVV